MEEEKRVLVLLFGNSMANNEIERLNTLIFPQNHDGPSQTLQFGGTNKSSQFDGKEGSSSLSLAIRCHPN